MMFKWLVVVVSLALSVFALYVAMIYAGHVNAQARWATAQIGTAMGFGDKATVDYGTKIVVSNGKISVYRSAGAEWLNVTDYTCVQVANATWWQVVCGPASMRIARGEYYVVVVKYPSLQSSYFSSLSSTLPVVLLIVLGLAAYIIYEYRR